MRRQNKLLVTGDILIYSIVTDYFFCYVFGCSSFYAAADACGRSLYLAKVVPIPISKVARKHSSSCSAPKYWTLRCGPSGTLSLVTHPVPYATHPVPYCMIPKVHLCCCSHQNIFRFNHYHVFVHTLTLQECFRHQDPRCLHYVRDISS
jgi:hypothetical protein